MPPEPPIRPNFNRRLDNLTGKSTFDPLVGAEEKFQRALRGFRLALWCFYAALAAFCLVLGWSILQLVHRL